MVSTEMLSNQSWEGGAQGNSVAKVYRQLHVLHNSDSSSTYIFLGENAQENPVGPMCERSPQSINYGREGKVCQRSTAVGWGAVLSEGEPMGDAPAFTLVMFTACISDRKGLAAARAESRLLKGEEL